MNPIYRWLKLIFIPLVGISMPFIFYSGDDVGKLFTWCTFSILLTFIAWESGSLIFKWVNRKFPLLVSTGKHITALIISFLMLTMILILMIYCVNLIFHTTGDNYWSEMKGVHLCIILGTFLLLSMHEGIDIYLNWKNSTKQNNGVNPISGQGSFSRELPENDTPLAFVTGNLLNDNVQNNSKFYRKNFTVQIGAKIRIIPINDIAFIYAMDKGVYIKTTANRDYLIDETLSELIHILDPEKFFRINRKFIVSIESISELITLSKSRLKVLLSPPSPVEIILGYPKSSELKTWLNK